MNKIQTKDKIVICTVILFSPILLFSQFVNPPYAGTTSDAHGNVGSMSAGTSYGYLNPAGGFSLYPTVSLGIYTGLYSDWILYYPTIKNISIRFPILINRLCLSASYGTPDDNRLKYAPNRNVFGMGKILNAYYKKEMSVSIAIHPPLKKYFNKLDVYLGTRVIRYWRSYASSSTLNDYGYGYIVRTGIFIDYSVFKKNKILLSGVVQPNSIPGFGYSAYPGFYGGAAGITHYLNLEKNEYLNLSGEILMPLWNESKISKLSAGLKYHFPTLRNNTIQCGIYSYSVDPYHQYKPVYWTTVGLSYEFKYFAFSIAMMDAINLNTAYREENDTGKIFSFSFDVPLKFKFVEKLSLGQRKQPIFKYFKYRSKPIKIGESDSIEVFVKNDGIDTLKSAQIFTNVLPQNGVFLPERIINTGDLLAGEIKKVEIPIEAVQGYLTQEYLLKAECFYSPEASNSIEIPIHTIEPVLNVTLKMKPYKQLLVGHIPGIFLITVTIHNSGNMAAKNVGVNFPEELKKKGIIKKTHIVIAEIYPGAVESVDYTLEFQDTLRSLTLPIKITFEEENGYAPEPYYTSIQLLNRGTLDRQLIQIDQFTNSFSEIKKYFIVLDGSLQDLEKLPRNIHYDSHFPGKIVIGPYSSFEEVYSNHVTVSQISESAEIYGINNSKVEKIDRYFLSVEKNDINIEKLTDLEIVSIYQSTLDSGVLLVGPFKSVLHLCPLLSFFERNFKHVVIQKQFPNEVELLHKN